ncbi:MAG: Sua5/YciO/YrdC/YwlC family protein, partial [Duncaniella sp.]|nr:Sua5/YciO/YrdC/YwlC family protein [Duncaniella sp.]
FKGRNEGGIRVPANPIASALADRLGHPLLSTSIPQDEDGVDPATVALEYEGVASLLIDGGEGEGIPSTVVDITDSRNPEIVREGKGELC